MVSDPESFPGLLEEYLALLQHHRGLRDSTLYVHWRWGDQFLRSLVERLPGADFRALTVSMIDDFVRPVAGRSPR